MEKAGEPQKTLLRLIKGQYKYVPQNIALLGQGGGGTNM